MKVRGGRPTPAQLARYKGIVHIVEVGARGLVARAWPRKRGPGGTPAQLAARNQFANVLQWVGEPMPQDVEAAQTIGFNTLYLPRDLMEAACYGTVMQAYLSDGRVLVGARLVAFDIQAALDTISSTVGAMLVRTGSGWARIAPGNANDVLISQGDGNLPAFLNLSNVPAAIPATVSQTLYVLPAAVTNPANTSENTIASYTVKAGTLAANGDAVRVSLAGVFADSTHNRTLRLYFGATLLTTFTLSIHNANSFITSPPVIINRLGATSQRASGSVFTQGTGGTVGPGVFNIAVAENLAADVLIKLTAQSASFGADTTVNQFSVEKLPHS